MKVIGAFSLIILLMMSGIVPILVNSLPNDVGTTKVENVSPLLVMFGDSEAEIAARNQLLQNFPNSNVIDFSASIQPIIDYTGSIVYIGHSSEKGISYNNQLVQWSFLSELIGKSVSNNHYILGCNSQIISEITAQTGKNVVSFDFEIDALLGVYAISLSIGDMYEVTKSILNEFLENAVSRIFEITENPSKALPMKLHGEELYTMGYLFFALIGTLYPLTGAVLSITGAIFVTTSLSVIAALYNLVDYAKNGGDAGVIVVSLSVIIKFMYQVLKSQILKLPWWRQATGFTALSADTAKNAIASVVVVLVCAAALAALGYYMTLFIYDVNDSDNTYW